MSKYNATELEALNKADLRELCRNNGIGYNGMNNEGMRTALLTVPGGEAEVAAANGTDQGEPVREPTDAEMTDGKANAEPLPVSEPKVLPTLVTPPTPAATAPVRRIQSNRPEAHGVKRPSEGTICSQIWAWCDEVHNAGDKVTAKELKAALPGLDATTCTVQFYRWRKFNGIQGRS